MYPALAVLQALERMHASNQPDALEVMWVGGESGMEKELVARERIPFRGIPAAGVHGVGMKALPGNIRKIVRGILAAREIIRDYQPDRMFFTGGYVSFPVALAGLKIPKLVFIPDIEPGMALKALLRFTRHVAVIVDETKRYLPAGKDVTVTGYPTRLSLAGLSREQALAKFGLTGDLPVLLVMGGSKGARSINRALSSVLADLLTEMQIIHISGKLDWEEVSAKAKQLPENLSKRYRVFDYLHEEMSAALGAADLVLSRGGASVLGEYPLFGLPAIIVPYPYAWRYQKVNAGYLVGKGAAVLLKDEELPMKIKEVVLSLMRDSEKRKRMADVMNRLKMPDAAREIAGIITRMAAGKGKKDGQYG